MMERIVPSQSRLNGGEEAYSARLLRTISMFHAKNGRLSEAMHCGRRQLAAARLTKNKSDTGPALFVIGYISSLQGNLTEAIKSLTEAVETLTDSGDFHQAAHAMQHLGTIHSRRSDYDRAEAYCIEAKKLLVQIGEKGCARLVECNVAGISALKGCYDDAEALYHSAQESFCGNQHEHGHIQLGLGDVHRGRGHYCKAEESYILSQLVLTRSGCLKGAAEAALGLGHVYRLQSDYIKAEAAYTEVGVLFGEADEYRAEGLLGLAAIRGSQERNDEAERLLTEASPILWRLGLKESLPGVDEELNSLYRRIRSVAQLGNISA
ncbi:hypothetical protein FRC05_009473 [Tulasnella sp. 425]|nr:hypothetical protein FRC05_009473 [Tulasnella sp. 425]